MDLGDLVDQFKELQEKKTALAEEVKANGKELEAAKQKLITAMVDAEMDGVVREGYSYTLTSKTKYSKKSGDDEACFETLRDNGLGALIKETVNAQSLQGAMSNLVEECGGELPEEILEVVNVYDFMDITRRVKK